MRTGYVQRRVGLLLIALACALGATTSSGAPQVPAKHRLSNAAASPDAILGDWWTQAEENRPSVKVRFTQSKDGTYMGVLVWTPKLTKDVHNKNPKLRDRSVAGIVLMWHLRYEDGQYVDGYVYNPEDGGTYRMKARLSSNDSLSVRGYLGLALFGQTQTWTRTRSK